MSLRKNVLRHVCFGELVIAQDAVLNLKMLFGISKSFGETEKSDPSPEKRILTVQHCTTVIAYSEEMIV